VPALQTQLTSPDSNFPADPASASRTRFDWPVRVYYEDTDAAGVVYYANYLRFFERCRTEWFRELGFSQDALAQREGVLFVVASAEIVYLKPARLDDALLIDARIAERAVTYVIFEQLASRETVAICRARVKVVCVDARTLRPQRIPATIADLLPPRAPHSPSVPT